MTIKQRLYLLVGVTVLGLCSVSGVGLYQMNKVFDTANWGNVNVVPSLILLDDVRSNELQIRLKLAMHVLSVSDADMAEIEKGMKNNRSRVMEGFNQYEEGGCFGISCISDDKDKDLLNKAKAAYMDYDSQIESVLAPSRKGDAGLVQARDMLYKTVVAAQKADAAIDEQFQYNAEIGKNATASAAAAKGLGFTLSIAISILSVIMMIVMGLLTVRNLLRQLGGEPGFVASLANKVAAGDLSTQIALQTGDANSVMAAMKNMVQAIQALVNDTDSLAKAAVEGRLAIRADASRHQGDFRKIVQGVNDTLDGVILPLNESVEVLTLVEQGDLTRTVNGDYKGQLGEFKDTVNNTIAKLSQTIAEVISAADQLGNASEQISSTSQSLSQASSEQAASVEQTSASIEQMSASINQNAENAKVTDSMAGKACKEAAEGGAAVRQTVTAMKDIAAKIGIIDDIAYQTNMLALNAAIEAARAGDHGKGFAVVAAEVRKLAERSQVAAQEIGELAETSVKTAESAGKLLDEIVPSIAKTSDLVQEISAASLEQSAGVSQVNIAMNQMNQITQQNASSSEELAATAEEMTGQAEQLQGLMSFFKIAGNNVSFGRFESKSVRKASLVEKVRPALQVVGRKGVDAAFDLSKFERF